MTELASPWDTLSGQGVVPEWTLKDRLRKAREHAGLTQDAMARRAHLSRRTIASYELGETTPGWPALCVWAMSTGVMLEWLEHGEVAAEKADNRQVLGSSPSAGARTAVELAMRRRVPRLPETAAA